MFELENVRDFRAAPAVDRLVVIAHHRHVAPLIREQGYQFELQTICVLKLVNHEIAKALAPTLADVRVLVQQLHGE